MTQNGVPNASQMDPWYTRAEARGNVHPEGLINSHGAGRTDIHNISVPAGSYIIPADVTSGLAEGNTLAGAGVMDRIMHSNPYGVQSGGSRHGSGPPRAPALHAPAFQAHGGKVKTYANGGKTTLQKKPVYLETEMLPVLSAADYAKILPRGVLSTLNDDVPAQQYVPPPIGSLSARPPTSSSAYPPSANDMPMYGGYAKGGSPNQHSGLVPIVVAGGELLYHPATIIKKFGSLKKGHAALDAFVKRVRTENIKTLRKLPGPKQ